MRGRLCGPETFVYEEGKETIFCVFLFYSYLVIITVINVCLCRKSFFPPKFHSKLCLSSFRLTPPLS